jgi:hypothetical protein
MSDQTHASMSLRSVSATLVLAAAAAAPWTSGANTHSIGKGWWVGFLLALAAVLLAAQSIAQRKFPALPRLAAGAAFFLLGCFAWWGTQPPLEFATPFSAEHWRFIEETFPFAVLQWPRGAHLVFLTCVILGFLAAAALGNDAKFRDDLCQVIGLSGLTFAAYALGIKWLGWSTPPWIDLANDTEQFNVGYFHHNAPGASLNLAWPLLFFATTPSKKIWAFGRRLLVLVVAVSALPLWHSRTAPVVAAGLLALGIFWQLCAARLSRFPALIPTTIAATFLGISAWQGWSIARMQTLQPDHWTSAAETKTEAPIRDAAIKAVAETRRDHLVASPAPSRPAAWLAALRMAKDYPFIGLGPDAWLTHAVLYSNDTIVNTFYQHRQFVHHDLLQIAAEWGGLAALAWVVLWAGAFRREAHWLTAAPGRSAGLLLALFGIAILSTVHFPLQNPALLLWTLLLLGLAWSPRVARPDPNPAANSLADLEHGPAESS